MQFCIVFAVVASLVSADMIPHQHAAQALPKAVCVWITQFLVVLVAWAICCQTKVDAACEFISTTEANRRLQLRSKLFCAVWLAMALISLAVFQWGTIVVQWSVFDSKLIRALILLMPMLVSLIASWIIWFDAEQALQADAGEEDRWEFVTSRIRYFLGAPLVPVLMVIGALDVIDAIAARSAMPAWRLLSLAPLAALVVLYPLLLRYLWPTRPLEAGPIRDRLLSLCRRFQAVPQDILIWNTGGRATNAAVAGILPWCRFVLVTDRVINDLSVQHLENVCLHEIAHVRLRHGLRLMMSLAGMLGAGCWFVSTVTSQIGVGPGGMALVGLVILLPLGCVGWNARLFELEADLWAMRRAGRPRDYIDAIAMISTSDSRDTSWLHPSFQQRHAFLARPADARAWLTSRLRLASLFAVLWIGVFAVLAMMLSVS